MYLRSLRLNNFRSYDDVTFHFLPGINHIVGKNAVGKTTILEAIYLLISGRSFRTQQHSELIRHNSPYFLVEAVFFKHGMEQRLTFAFDGRNKKITLNRSICPSYANLLGIMTGVVFTPDDPDLVKGGPAERRQFMDLHIAQFDPLYVHFLSRYNKAMRQRNCLLRSGQLQAIAPWEEEMSGAAEYLLKKRIISMQSLAHHADEVYKEISGEAVNLHVGFKSTWCKNEENIRQSYLTLLQKNRLREKELGFTLSGPHKDDLSFTMAGKEVKIFGSEGQQRSCVASLKFSSWIKLQKEVGINPLLLTDDIEMGLDGGRTERLHTKLMAAGQVFLTSTKQVENRELRPIDALLSI